MSYRCGVCAGAVPPGQARKVWSVRRADGNIAAEVPACGRCHHLLGEGVPLSELRARLAPADPEPGTPEGRGKVAPAPEPPPPPPEPPGPVKVGEPAPEKSLRRR